MGCHGHRIPGVGGPYTLSMAPTRLVIHVDDIGMCHGTTTAFAATAEAGAVTCGSVMVPCPWSSEALELAAAQPELDVGVHLTLNAEHRHYRWAPMSRAPRLSGLVDHSGAMWRSVVDLRGNADPDAVMDEWRTQVDRALSAGVDVTHLDSHMGSAMAPEWAERYVALGVEYGLPVVLPATIAGYGIARHLPDVTEDDLAPVLVAAREAGMPVFDRIIESDFSRPAGVPLDLVARLRSAVAGGGLAYLALHPCHPGEIEAIDPARPHVRTDEADALESVAWRAALDDLVAAGEVELVGMRQLRDGLGGA
jgi:hypothetical protein